VLTGRVATALPPSPGEGRAPVVGVYDPAPEAYLPWLREIAGSGRLRVCARPDGLRDGAGDVEVLLAFKWPPGPFPREEILALPRLRWVQLASAGVDHMLPFDPARVTVTSASGLHGDAMAEYVIGTLVMMRWDFPRLLAQQAARRWETYEVPTLAGLTMGIVGAGHVGSRIGARARAFGMRVVGVRRSGRPADGFDEIWTPDRTSDLFRRADVVVLSLPLTPETRGIIGARELSRLKKHAWLVNVSRGGIVDETALAAVLRAGRIGGAILDVFEREPLPPENEFWTLPNVFVTPHISSEFAGWRSAVARLFAANLRRWVAGEPLANVVEPSRGY
jgi:phosphoglycerate dehydrogenase-like enzyme